MKSAEKHPFWCFPETGGKGNSGINSGIPDSFRTAPLDSLVRECCQNSLDAAYKGKPVTIEFKTFSIPTSDLPDVSELKQHILACSALADKKNSPTQKEVYDQAKKLINKNRIFCLRISDFNTTGLRGSRERESPESESQWISCVRSIGSSGGKGENSAGSQGLGKATTYYNSAIRTVFFNTLDIDGYAASEGVSALVSHSDGTGAILDSTGYYSCEHDGQKCRAVFSQTELDPDFKRTEPGTDIFIIAFNNSEKELVTALKIAAVDSFLPAIMSGKFVIRSGKKLISKDTLPDIMKYLSSEEVPKNRKTAARKLTEFYKVMASDAVVYHEDTDSLGVNGSFEMKLLTGDDLCNRIAIYREIGMKIKEVVKNVTYNFAGVLTIKGPELNTLLKNMETTAHDEWQVNVYVDLKKRALASRVTERLKSFIKDIVKNSNESTQLESMDSGLGELLPDIDNLDSSNKKYHGGQLTLDKTSETDFIDTLSQLKNDEVSGEKNGKESSLFEDNEGGINEEEFLYSSNLKNSQKVKEDSEIEYSEDSDQSGGDTGEFSADLKYSTVDIPVMRKKMIASSVKNQFIVKFIPEADIQNAMIKLNVAGECGGYRIPVLSASNSEGALNIENDYAVQGFSLTRNKECRIEITLKDNPFKSFSVSVYAYKEK